MLLRLRHMMKTAVIEIFQKDQIQLSFVSSIRLKNYQTARELKTPEQNNKKKIREREAI
jgi:hypothetical protein